MAAVRFYGALGSSTNYPVIDPGTMNTSRSPNPGTYCRSEDPSLLDKAGYVEEAWELAASKYIRAAIVRHAGAEIESLISGLLPALLAAVGVLIVTTLIGAGVGAVFGAGAGAAPGAAAGLEVGLFILEWLGIGFLAVFIGEHLGEMTAHIVNGIKIAWESCGSDAIDRAAREFAEGIGVFFGLLVQALFLLVMEKGLAEAVKLVGKSKLGAGFSRWLKGRVSLNGFLKAVEKPPGDYLFTTDNLGRPVEAEGWLIKADGVRDPAVNSAVTQGLEGYHAGHLIPNTFRGPSVPNNLVPMPEVTNLSYVKAVENAVGRHLQEGPVYLKVTVEYSDAGKIPSTVRHRFYKLSSEGMEMIPGGDVTTNIQWVPSKAMGKVVSPKDFLSPDPTKGVVNKLPQ